MSNIAPMPAARAQSHTRFVGTVKWFNVDKGYGFIVPDEAGPDIFLHATTIQKSGFLVVQEGDRMSYEVARRTKNGRDGFAAVNVMILRG